MRVLIADKHDQVRSALRLLLEQETNVEAIGEAPASERLLIEIGRFKPDVLILDWRLAGAEVDKLVAQLQLQPALAIIVLSSRPEDRQAARTAGIIHFVSKNAYTEELLSVLRGIQSAVRPTSSDLDDS